MDLIDYLLIGIICLPAFILIVTGVCKAIDSFTDNDYPRH